jgi:hypothetical protein
VTISAAALLRKLDNNRNLTLYAASSYPEFDSTKRTVDFHFLVGRKL